MNPSPHTHNGTWTLLNTTTGRHKTYRIRTRFKHSENAYRVLEVMNGPDNTNDYKELGRFDDDMTLTVHLGLRHSVWDRLALTFVAVLFDDKYRDRIEVSASTTCRICNRKLTTPESIKSGIGPTCAGREVLV